MAPRRPLMPLLVLLTAAAARAGGLDALPPVMPPTDPAPVRSVAAGTDGAGRFVVAWVSRDRDLPEGGGDHLHAARWDDTRWTPLGDVVNEKPAYNAAQPHVHAGPDGSVWLDWEEGTGLAHIDSFLMSNWTGARWTSASPYALRRNLSDAGRSRSLALSAGNTPLVGWTDIGTGTRSAYPSVVSLWRWQGSGWQTTPYANLNVQTPAFMPSVAQTGGRTFMAFVEGPTTRSDLWVREWTPAGWRTLGGRVNRRARTYLFKPQLLVDPQGRLTLAWLEDAGGQDALYVTRWDGARWQPLGTGPASTPGQHASSHALGFGPDGQPVTAWNEGPDGSRSVRAARWDGARWLPLGGTLNRDPRADTDHASLAAGPRGVLVAWRELSGGRWTVQTRRVQ